MDNKTRRNRKEEQKDKITGQNEDNYRTRKHEGGGTRR